MPGTGLMPPDGHSAMCQRALQQRLQGLHCSAQPSMSGRALHPEPVQRRKMLRHERGCQLQCAAVAEMDPVALDATRRGALLGVVSLMPVCACPPAECTPECNSKPLTGQCPALQPSWQTRSCVCRSQRGSRQRKPAHGFPGPSLCQQLLAWTRSKRHCCWEQWTQVGCTRQASGGCCL